MFEVAADTRRIASLLAVVRASCLRCTPLSSRVRHDGGSNTVGSTVRHEIRNPGGTARQRALEQPSNKSRSHRHRWQRLNAKPRFSIGFAAGTWFDIRQRRCMMVILFPQ